jgi:NADH dehydrogenase
MNDRTVTVFGGTGFLGRRVVRHLRKHGFSVQIASRHPDRGHRLFGLDPQIQSVEANIHDERSVADALAGAFGVVNAVSLYVEHGQETFHSVHVESAERVAAQAHRAGVERLAHVSGIGSDAFVKINRDLASGWAYTALPEALWPNYLYFQLLPMSAHPGIGARL